MTPSRFISVSTTNHAPLAPSTLRSPHDSQESGWSNSTLISSSSESRCPCGGFCGFA